MVRGEREPGPSDAAGDVLRPFIFGDRPLESWPEGDDSDQGDPWDTFVRARAAITDGDRGTATTLWLQIASSPESESRQVLQAWRFLRDAGEQPSESIARQVLGGVVEVPVNGHHDLLAAYADGSVRYLNHSGKAAILEPGATGPQLAQAARGFLTATGLVADVAGPWDQPSLPPLPDGHARVTALTPGGIRFGQGPEEQLRRQPPAADMILSALVLLSEIVDIST